MKWIFSLFMMGTFLWSSLKYLYKLFKYFAYIDHYMNSNVAKISSIFPAPRLSYSISRREKMFSVSLKCAVFDSTSPTSTIVVTFYMFPDAIIQISQWLNMNLLLRGRFLRLSTTFGKWFGTTTQPPLWWSLILLRKAE